MLATSKYANGKQGAGDFTLGQKFVAKVLGTTPKNVADNRAYQTAAAVAATGVAVAVTIADAQTGGAVSAGAGLIKAAAKGLGSLRQSKQAAKERAEQAAARARAEQAARDRAEQAAREQGAHSTGIGSFTREIDYV